MAEDGAIIKVNGWEDSLRDFRAYFISHPKEEKKHGNLIYCSKEIIVL